MMNNRTINHIIFFRNRIQELIDMYSFSFFFKLLVISLVFSGLITPIFAQEDVVNITRTFEPTISEARKPDFRPNTSIDSLQIQPSFSYRIVPYQFKTGFSPSTINAAKLVPSRNNYHYGNFLRLGFGSNISPLAELKLYHLYKRKWKLGMEAYHESAFPTFRLNDQAYFPHYNQSHLKLMASRQFQRRLFSSALSFESNGANFYGFDFESPASSEINKDSVNNRQVSVLNLSTKLKSLNLSRNYLKVDYGLDYYLLLDHQNTTEHGGFFNVNASKSIKSFEAHLDLGLELLHRDLTDFSKTNINIRLNPYITKEKDEWKAVIGANTATKLDADEEARFFIYPNLQFEFALAEEFLHSYFGFTGEMKDNFSRQTLRENPFVVNNYEIRPTEVRKNIYIGFRGLITESLKYNVKASYQDLRDMMLFAGTHVSINDYRFDVIYTNADRFNGLAELSYSYRESFVLGARINYDNYSSLSNAVEAWLIPNWSGSLLAQYHYNKYLSMNTEFTVLSNRRALDRGTFLATSYISNILPVVRFLDLNEVYNWNIGFDYKYNSKVTAFIQFENILGQKYFIYNYYPAQGFRARIGISYFF